MVMPGPSVPPTASQSQVAYGWKCGHSKALVHPLLALANPFENVNGFSLRQCTTHPKVIDFGKTMTPST